MLRLWVSSVDYSADVPIGPDLRQLADVYRKVRNTSRYLLGNLHDFNPATDAIPLRSCLLDRWMLQRTAEVMDDITGSKARVLPLLPAAAELLRHRSVELLPRHRQGQALRECPRRPAPAQLPDCNGPDHRTPRRTDRPVLCHMAEDIWQNLPYPVEESSVFQRSWPKVPIEWRDAALGAPVQELRELRAAVNKVLEDCRGRRNSAHRLRQPYGLTPAVRNSRPLSPG